MGLLDELQMKTIWDGSHNTRDIYTFYNAQLAS